MAVRGIVEHAQLIPKLRSGSGPLSDPSQAVDENRLMFLFPILPGEGAGRIDRGEYLGSIQGDDASAPAIGAERGRHRRAAGAKITL